MFGVVYLIRNLVNAKVYVGKTTAKIGTRWIDHCRKDPRSAMQRAVQKYGRKNFEIRPLRHVESEEELNTWESIYILLFGSHVRINGYNKTYGGDGTAAAEELREKKRLAGLGPKNPFFGKRHSLETRARWSLIRRGRKQTDSYMEKMKGRFVGENNPFFGKRHSEETKRLIAEKGMGKANAAGPHPSWKGMRHRPETIEKMRAAHKLRVLRQKQQSGSQS